MPGDAGATVDASFRKAVLEPDVTNPMQLNVAPDGRVFFIERAGRLKAWSPDSTRLSSRTLGTVAFSIGRHGRHGRHG